MASSSSRLQFSHIHHHAAPIPLHPSMLLSVSLPLVFPRWHPDHSVSTNHPHLFRPAVPFGGLGQARKITITHAPERQCTLQHSCLQVRTADLGHNGGEVLDGGARCHCASIALSVLLVDIGSRSSADCASQAHATVSMTRR